MKKLVVILTACAFSLSVFGGQTGPGSPNYDSINGLLSDFQQSYGQVVGDDVTVGNGRITSLKVWGLYYDYTNDWGNTPPLNDDFTLRLHKINSGDPEEDHFFELDLGAGVRTSTGQSYSDVLDIYEYEFSGLNIPVSSGTYLFSVIDNVPNAAEDGYWHWVSSNDDGTAWWRREDNQPEGQENTLYWTENAAFTGDRAMTLNVVPVPGALLLGGLGVGCVSYLRRRRSL